MTEKELLRQEHNKRVADGVYKELLGCTCVNCGSTESIEYHHIVPICVGGSNKLSNICPVCLRCHKAIHGEKDYREYAASKKKPVKKIRKDLEDAIELYVNCKIDITTLKNMLGAKSSLSQNHYYRTYLKSHGIKQVVNNMRDMIEDCSWPPSKGSEVGYILYANGRVKTIFYE